MPTVGFSIPLSEFSLNDLKSASAIYGRMFWLFAARYL